MGQFQRLVPLVLMAFAAPGVALAQEAARHEVLRAGDGVSIHITYYPFRESKDNSAATGVNAPVVVLLPGAGENRLLWDKSSAPREQDPFPLLLQKRGYVVISVDLRQHGESKIEGRDDPLLPNDYQAMVLGDMVAVKDFIYAEHQAQRLNMQKMAIVAVGTSVPIAAAFAEFDWSQRPYDDAPLAAERTPRGQDVKLLVFLSPESSVGRVKASASLKALRNPAFKIAMQIIVGAANAGDKRQADSLYQSFASLDKDRTRVELLTPDVKDQGISLMRVPIVYVSVLKFLETHLKGLDIPWQDRRSRLER